MKIKDLPTSLRPREKATRYGIKTLSDIELIALLLGSGTKTENVIEVSTKLLSKIGGLEGLIHCNNELLKQISGIKEVKALILEAVKEIYIRVENQSKEDPYFINREELINKVIRRYQRSLGDSSQEVLIVVLMKNKKIIQEKILYIGTSSKISISIKDILREVVLHNATGFYLIHSHPSQIAIPSEEDIHMTKLIKEKAYLVNVRLIDSIIITRKDYISIFDYLDKLNLVSEKETTKLIN